MGDWKCGERSINSFARLHQPVSAANWHICGRKFAYSKWTLTDNCQQQSIKTIRPMDNLTINSRLTILSDEIEVISARSSGPGGQNVNKVNSKIVLRWSPYQCESLPGPWRKRFVDRFANRINRDGQIVLHSEKYRDRPRNLEDARQRLRDMLLQTQHAPKKRIATKPSRNSQRRRLDNKTKQSQKKQNRRKDIRFD